MLRIPSKGLPITFGTNPLAPLPDGQHSRLAACGDEIIPRLVRRQNKPYGSTMKRACTCAKAPRLCPLHVLGKWIAGCQDATPFAKFSANFARTEINRRAVDAGFEGGKHYCLHDLRRGHAQKILQSNCNLQQILRAGEWVSPAFLRYLDTVKVDRDWSYRHTCKSLRARKSKAQRLVEYYRLPTTASMGSS